MHISHVLWGGLLMALAFVVLMTFIGPVVRRFAVLLSVFGFGLFIDEVGKFVTSDYDYFWEPTAALTISSSSPWACSPTCCSAGTRATPPSSSRPPPTRPWRVWRGVSAPVSAPGRAGTCRGPATPQGPTR